VRLTPEIAHRIVSYIEAGSFDYVAAEAAGIDERTFRDWMARGEERHPTRRTTPQLRLFAEQVRQARARARAGREIVVADKDPKFWLQHVARSKPNRDGWTEPIDVADEAGATIAYQPDRAELAEIFRVLVDVGALELEPCGDPECRCATHRPGADP
jgi:catechol 2,3-dioxygenase-like lactoylglutathione lyase family enzyme